MRRAGPCDPGRVAAALGIAAERWREREFGPRRATVAALAAGPGMAPALLDESIDALLEPVSRAALDSFAATLPATPRLFGFLMPGNVPGAGIHEICAAMLAGAGVIIKTASAEPWFFANFIDTLAGIDAGVAARAAVVNFGREDGAA
ncbi:MAG TPA: acyl-CoA reductase, partial [Candidatus Binataceae bacterium]|nr:acyl-CoA reductase [Candidatus Binataceae bacterium]